MSKLLFGFVVLISFAGRVTAEFQVNNGFASDSDKPGSDLLNIYKVGGREQRVRFFAGNVQYLDFDDNSAFHSTDRLKGDSLRLNQKYSWLGAISEVPHKAGFTPFLGEKNRRYGLIISPHLVLCGSKLLEQLQKVGENEDVKKIFEKFKIDEINIFLFITTANDPKKHYKLEIAPEGPALKIQIPLIVPSGECLLTGDKRLREAIEKAAVK